MSLLSAFLLGLIQGVAEFLPISSSGHLAIAQNLFHLTPEGVDDVFFSILLHLGTLVAVFVAYWGDIREMVVEFFLGIRDIARRQTPTPVPPARRLILLIIVATLPLFAVLPIKDWVEGLSDNIYFVAGALIVTGFLLFASDRVRKGRKTEKTAALVDVLLVGVAQAIATIPGISRSGSTISAGMALGFDRKFAVRYSFLMSLPAVLGATLLEVVDVASAQTVISPEVVPMYAVGMVLAGVVGFFSIKLVNLLASKGKFGAFAYYCWAVGLLALIGSLVGFTFVPAA